MAKAYHVGSPVRVKSDQTPSDLKISLRQMQTAITRGSTRANKLVKTLSDFLLSSEGTQDHADLLTDTHPNFSELP